MNIKTLIFNPPVSGGILILLAFLLIGLTILLYARKWREKRSRPVLILAAILRCLVLLTVIFLLAKPQIEEVRQSERLPTLAVVLDGSASMSLPVSADAKSRWQAASESIQELGENNLFEKYKTNYFVFGDKLKKVNQTALTSLSPEFNQTDLPDVFNELYLNEDYPDLAAVLIFTDGQDTTKKNPAELLEKIKLLNRPVFPVGLGAAQVADARIDNVHVAGTAYLDHPLDLSVSLTNNGLTAEKVVLTLIEENQTIVKQGVMLPQDGKQAEKKLTFIPRQVGWRKYQVAFEPSIDDVIPRNNQTSFYINIIKEKLNVLFLSGAVGWDLSFMKRFLENEANLKVDSYFQGLQGKFFSAEKNEINLLEELSNRFKEYELVIVNNLEYESLGDALSVELEEYVNNGGSLLMHGGPQSFGSGDYYETALAKLSPLVIKTKDYVAEEVVLRLADQWYGSSKLNQVNGAWKSLPSLYGYHNFDKMKPGAELIAYNALNKNPLIVRQFYGAGKVMVVGVQSTWRWDFLVKAFDEETEPYARFWRELIGWLLTIRDESKLYLESNKHIYQLGDEVNIYLKAEKAGAVDKHQAQLVSGGQTVSSVNFSPLDEKTYQASVLPERVGDYFVRIEQAEIRFSVVSPQDEFLKPDVNQDTLKLLATVSGGKNLTLENLKEEIENLPAEKIVEINKKHYDLLDYWQIFLGLVVFLGAEWLLQKVIGID